MKTLLIILLCTFPFLVFGQQKPKDFIITGKIVEAKDTAIAIPYAHVINLRTKLGIAGNDEGRFKMMMTTSDSLHFRIIGYRDTVLSYNQLKKLNFKVPLQERVYQLKQVKVTGERLTKPFAPAKPSEDPYAGYPSVRPSGRKPEKQVISLGSSSMGTGAALQGGITALANKFNRKEQQREVIRELERDKEAQEYYQQLFRATFTKELVEKETGLQGKQLEEFLSFCTPSTEFLENASEYDILIAIKDYFKKYKNINKY